VPMLPPTITCAPAAFINSPVSAVVVVLPFEPVMPITRPRRKRPANSGSLMISTARPRAISSCGKSAGTPGLRTIKSALANNSSGWPPSARRTPTARNSAASPASCDSSFRSLAVTRAPRAASRRATATPLRAMPTTRMFFPATSIVRIQDSEFRIQDKGCVALNPESRILNPAFSSELQRRPAEQGKQNRHDQKAKNQLRFHAPRQLCRVHQLEVMMQGRHLENTALENLERRNLQD